MEIGVPTRFSTPRADIDVVTRAARAPALLTAYKVDAAGERLQVDLHLQTGTRTTDRQTLAGIIEGPFQGVVNIDGADQAAILPAVPNLSYFLHSYVVNARLAVANTGTYVGFWWVPANDPAGGLYCDVFTVPSAAAAYNMTGILDTLTYPGTAVGVDKTGTFANTSITIVYSIVSGVM